MSALPSSLQLSAQFDSARLQAELDRLLTDRGGSPFNPHDAVAGWSTLPLRSAGDTGAERRNVTRVAPGVFADTPWLELCPQVRHALAFFQCPQYAVQFQRLEAGSTLKARRDHTLKFEDGKVRLHIPILTNPDVEFFLAGKRVVMSEGECWYHDLTLSHSVANRGASDRIHLLVDCGVNDWLREMLVADSMAARR